VSKTTETLIAESFQLVSAQIKPLNVVKFAKNTVIYGRNVVCGYIQLLETYQSVKTLPRKSFKIVSSQIKLPETLKDTKYTVV
jgi:hypothetical protein